MEKITREEAIKVLEFDMSCGEFYQMTSDSVEHAISDMRKLEKIEKLIVNFKEQPFEGIMKVSMLVIEIEKIVKE